MSDLVGPTGIVYAVEFSHRSGRDLVNMAKKRTNVIPIIEDARHPNRYRMLMGMVDVIFADVAQPDQVLFESMLKVFLFFLFTQPLRLSNYKRMKNLWIPLHLIISDKSDSDAFALTGL